MVLELEGVLCQTSGRCKSSCLEFAVFRRASPSRAGANQWAKLYTVTRISCQWYYIGRHGLLKQSYTVGSLYLLAYTLLQVTELNSIYHHKPLYTVIKSDIP